MTWKPATSPPDFMKPVLVWDGLKLQIAVRLQPHTGNPVWYDDRGVIEVARTVTHWMELPEPPGIEHLAIERADRLWAARADRRLSR